MKLIYLISLNFVWDAEQFYDFSDGRNAELVLNNSPQDDCTIYCSGDRYYKE